VAPFDVGAHRPLALGFYWSPLKVFEYMASALPVVAPDIDRLRTIVRHGRDGVLYDAANPNGLANAIDALRDSDTRMALGTSARERAVERFGWDTHCQTLTAAMKRALQQRPGRGYQA
jgi:glycosyltransferase involved in cell wall biosynthesis